MSRQSILGLDIIFSYRDRVWGKSQENLCRDREFDVVTELLEICVGTKSSKT